jgi:hypothetical protein
MKTPYRYDETKALLKRVLEDFRILSGDQMGPSGVTQQAITVDLALNLVRLSRQIDAARLGQVADGPLVFPSPDDL